jgi:protein-S-isoprenylcysteine O-methyltransferase Ste14
MKDLPLTLLTATIWVYWLVVSAMIVRVHQKTRTLAGAIPEQRLEQGMWFVWVPLIVTWAVLPYLAATRSHPLLAVPEFAHQDPLFSVVRWGAAVCGLVCLAATGVCWRRMGRNWRISVTPRERTELVTTGMYAYLRHPIYALSILLMLCSAVVVATVPMLVVAAIHVVLMVLKARNEEQFLLSVHGDAYRSYCRRTGRFFPRLQSRDFPA